MDPFGAPLNPFADPAAGAGKIQTLEFRKF